MVIFVYNNYPPDLGGIEDVDEILMSIIPWDVISWLFFIGAEDVDIL